MMRLFQTILFGAVASAIAVLLLISTAWAQPSNNAPDYVDSAACVTCHKKEYEGWKTSHHAWALKTPDSSSVLADFNNSTFLHKGVTSRFYQENEAYFVEFVGKNKTPQTYKIQYTVGVEPLQQYLVELPGGKLQALDVAWDTKLKRWFHLYPDQTLKPGDGLHWTGPYKNWNARCAVCHQTSFRKNYDPKKRIYNSRWSETTVTCQACHGPAEAHIKWSQANETFDMSQWKGVDARGLVQQFSRKNPQLEIETCAQCHSRRGVLEADSPPAASRFPDHHRLALLRNGLYFPDGQINDEVYVYGSFLQSKMYARGVRCSNCHEPHSGSLKAEGNAVCTQCHSQAGNDDFPSLKKLQYDDAAHHHHETGSPGAQCVNCHMPAKTYMQVDPRRDHSFRIPRPDLSEKINTPNACNVCHQDQTAQWAAAKIEDWFPDGRAGKPHFGELFDAGRRGGNAQAMQGLVDTALDLNQAAVVRATALHVLYNAADEQLITQVVPLLKDESDLVRRSAVRLMDRMSVQVRINLVAPLLRDPIRAVRLEAARLIVAVPAEQLPETLRTDARKAVGEYQQSLLAQADFPETQMQIAGLAMVTRNFAAAQEALKTTLVMDPQFAQAWLTLVRIQSALGKHDEARKTLEQAAVALPDNGEVFLRLGAEYTRSRSNRRAIEALDKSLELSGVAPVLLELLVQNHMALNDVARARAYATQLMSVYPDHQPSPLVRQLLQLQQ